MDRVKCISENFTVYSYEEYQENVYLAIAKYDIYHFIFICSKCLL